jgi:CMP-N-acetylneuraminic acid synthetase
VNKHIAIIPARGGSKRIPNKNITDFGGRPMLAWTVDAALSSGCFDTVLVSTDSEAIAEVAANAGAAVPFLRQVGADDVTPVSQATMAALIQAEAHWATSFDTVTQLMPNCPLRQARHIRDAWSHFTAEGIAFQVSCFKFGWMNPWWAHRLDAQGHPEAMFPDALRQRSQDLPALYCPSGAIWMARRQAFGEAGTFYGPGHRFFPLHWVAAMDIDDAEDLQMAQLARGLMDEGSR